MRLQPAFGLSDRRLHFLQHGRGIAAFGTLPTAGGRIQQEGGDGLSRRTVQTPPFVLPPANEAAERAVVGQHGGQVLPQADFAVEIESHRVEAAANMQTAPRQHIRPSRKAAAGGEVKHRHQRFGAPRQYGQLVFIFVQHRLARIDNVKGGVALQQLAQHFRLLPEFPRGRWRGEEGLQAVYAVFARRRVRFQPV